MNFRNLCQCEWISLLVLIKLCSQYPCSSPHCVGIYKWNAFTQSTYVLAFSLMKYVKDERSWPWNITNIEVATMLPTFKCKDLELYTLTDCQRGKKKLEFQSRLGKACNVYTHGKPFLVLLLSPYNTRAEVNPQVHTLSG